MTSMTVRDEILPGDSYYFRKVRCSETKNAIELLKYIGFPKEIVTMAQSLSL